MSHSKSNKASVFDRLGKSKSLDRMLAITRCGTCSLPLILEDHKVACPGSGTKRCDRKQISGTEFIQFLDGALREICLDDEIMARCRKACETKIEQWEKVHRDRVQPAELDPAILPLRLNACFEQQGEQTFKKVDYRSLKAEVTDVVAAMHTSRLSARNFWRFSLYNLDALTRLKPPSECAHLQQLAPMLTAICDSVWLFDDGIVCGLRQPLSIVPGWKYNWCQKTASETALIESLLWMLGYYAQYVPGEFMNPVEKPRSGHDSISR